MQQTLPVITIAGTTASGKTALALRLAKDINAEIISADAIQVYRLLDIGSAKPSVQELREIKHHYIDELSLGEVTSAGLFRKRALDVMHDIRARGKNVIVVGGTNLYLSALLEGLSPLPEIAPALRAQVLAMSSQELYEELLAKDAKRAAQIHINDHYRLSRAVELLRAGGTTVSQQYADPKDKIQSLIYILNWEREEIYQRVNLRTKQMLELGLVNEVESVISKFPQLLTQVRGPLSSVGYAQVVAYIQGRLPLEQLESEIAQETRNLVKRQLTFWRNEPAKRGWTQKTVALPYDYQQLLKEITCSAIPLNTTVSYLPAQSVC